MSLCSVCFTFALMTNVNPKLIMKKIPLLPRYFRWIGVILFTLTLVLYVIDTIERGGEGIYTKSFVLINDPFMSEKGFLKFMEVEITLTLFLSLTLFGLAGIAFSRNKVEDEMINSVRLFSWSWAIIYALIFCFIATVFVYGTTFVRIISLFPQELLLFYIIIFHISIFKLNRKTAVEE